MSGVPGDGPTLPVRTLPVPARAILDNPRATDLAVFRVGEATAVRSRDPLGRDGAPVWSLTVGHPKRDPTWQEIKTARYRCLPPDATMALLLPPPERYVNDPLSPHLFHLTEVADLRAVSWKGRPV